MHIHISTRDILLAIGGVLVALAVPVIIWWPVRQKALQQFAQVPQVSGVPVPPVSPMPALCTSLTCQDCLGEQTDTVCMNKKTARAFCLTAKDAAGVLKDDQVVCSRCPLPSPTPTPTPETTFSCDSCLKVAKDMVCLDKDEMKALCKSSTDRDAISDKFICVKCNVPPTTVPPKVSPSAIPTQAATTAPPAQ